jgi:hypothetical protein
MVFIENINSSLALIELYDEYGYNSIIPDKKDSTREDKIKMEIINKGYIIKNIENIKENFNILFLGFRESFEKEDLKKSVKKYVNSNFPFNKQTIKFFNENKRLSKGMDYDLEPKHLENIDLLKSLIDTIKEDKIKNIYIPDAHKIIEEVQKAKRNRYSTGVDNKKINKDLNVCYGNFLESLKSSSNYSL